MVTKIRLSSTILPGKEIICLINNRAAQKCFSTLPTLWINVGSVNVWNLAWSLFPYNVSFILIFSNSVAVPFRWLLKGRITEQNQTIEHTYITLMKHKLSWTPSSKFVAFKQLYNDHQVKCWSPSSPGIYWNIFFSGLILLEKCEIHFDMIL